MDDDLEDEIFYQTLLSHGKIISKFIVGIPFHPSISTVARHARFYVLTPECFLLLFFILCFVVYFSNFELLLKYAFNKFHFASTISSFSSSSIKNDPKLTVYFSSPMLTSETVWQLKQENVAVYAIKGRRPQMEDRFHVLHDKDLGISLYGIFDGHGGEAAVEYVRKHLFNRILMRLQNHFKAGESITDYSNVLTEEIISVDKELVKEMKDTTNIGGTTAVVALVTKQKLYVANVGDSRGVMCDSSGATRPLTFDHKPQQTKERIRIQNAGGFVSFNGVWRVAGILATSRALGDFPLKERNFVIPDPDILTFNLNDIKPKFIILATDGVWDIFKNEEAVEFVKGVYAEDSHFGAKALVMQSYVHGSLDNISVMVVKFNVDPQD